MSGPSPCCFCFRAWAPVRKLVDDLPPLSKSWVGDRRCRSGFAAQLCSFLRGPIGRAGALRSQLGLGFLRLGSGVFKRDGRG